MLALFLGLLLRSGQAAEPGSISFVEYAAPFKRLLPRLCEAVHEELHLSPELENEVLCISVHDVPKAGLLEKVAAATGARWRIRGRELWLYPDAAARGIHEARGIAKRTARIQKTVDQLEMELAKLERPNPTPDPYEVARRAYIRFYLQLLHSVGLATIAALPPEGRTVFSTVPNPSQRLLGPECTALAEEYDRATQKLKSGEGASPAVGGRADAPNPPEPISKLDVIFEGWAQTITLNTVDRVDVRIRAYDRTGRYIRGVGAWDTVDSGFYWPDNTSVLSERRAPRGGRNLPIPISERTKRFEKFVWTDSHGTNAPLREEAVALLKRPDLVDPLQYAGELLVGTARAKQLQLVACVSDALIQWMPGFWVGFGYADPGPDDVEAALDVETHSSEFKDGGWLVVSRTDSGTASVDRLALARLTQRIAERDDLNFGDVGEVALSGFLQPGGSRLVDTWLPWACPELFELHSDWTVARMLASMGAEQRKRSEGDGVPLNSLSPETRSLVRAFVMDSSPGELEIEPQAGSHDEPENPDWDALDGRPFSPADMRAEPTEVLPQGLTGTERVVTSLRREAVIRPARVGPGQREYPMAGWTPGDLGGQAASYEDGAIVYDDQIHTTFRSIQVGERQTYRLRIRTDAGSFRERSFTFPVFTSKERYTMSTLPKEMRDEYDKQAAEAVKRAKAELEEAQKSVKP
ncbi:MAG TPA: hypothetical protein VKT78_13025 [Fimbriimonadaceae bacterium]|nr:hypothetical protein [Fimbriimonadaceae bacterium]